MFLALTLALLQGASPSGPRTLRVGADGEHSTVAGAISAAREGDTVRVTAGIHRGGVRVERRLFLVGEPGAILDGGGMGSVVTLAADSAVLEGFAIRNSGRSLDRDDAAVKLERCTGCRVAENRISGSLHGIYLLESRAASLVGNEIRGERELAEARRGNGIHLFHSAGNRLERNRISGTRDGIYFSFASHNQVAGNEVSQVRYGLHYMYSDDNEFHGNRFTRNAAGAAIMFSRRIVFEENTFSEHVGYRAYGILLQTSGQIRAERNRIQGNLVGVFLDNATRNVFRENSISGNGTGVDLLSSAEGNTFVGNAFVDNRTAVRKAVGSGPNTWSLDGRGNFWNDRSVFDLDSDGVGDRPYEAGDPFAALALLRPALEAFTGTPAARALSWAERAYPVFGLPRVEDPAPLISPPAGVPGGRAAMAGGPLERSGGRRSLAVALPLLLGGAWGMRRIMRSNQR